VSGHDTLDLPVYSFLIENEQAHKKVLFDLGIMKDWKEKRPDLLDQAQSFNATFEAHPGVCDLLASASVPLSSIDAIIWSSHQADHFGDASLFPPTTSLVVGTGFKSNPSTYPGFPLNPDGQIPHAAFEGRDVIELDFNRTTGVLKLAGLRAIDWFDDGSLYLLEAPGPAPDQIMALARTSADKFVLLAGDAAIHPGVIRPSTLCPLPDSITPSPFEPAPNSSSYNSALLARAHPSAQAYRTTPFYQPTKFVVRDPVAGRATHAAIQAFDDSEHVLVVLSNDPSFREANAVSLARWEEPRGEGALNRKEAVHWRFLSDFQKGVEV
jgi:glyoxylase-like metal-dependent hydrolase (beta-lactamase superfamily II)